MSNNKQPTFGNGKICYIEIPAIDIDVSSAFYQTVFGWDVRKREDGSVGFDDGVGEVSGSWVIGRKPHVDAGVMISIMVDDMEASLKSLVSQGGKITRPVGADHPEITAQFSDPAGNIFGLYQHRG